MSKVNPDDEFARWKAEQEFKTWKAAQGGPSQRELDARAKARQATNEVEAGARTKADDLGAIAQTFSDASTFGASGLAIDALSAIKNPNFASVGHFLASIDPATFRANRDARKASREKLSGYDRTLATVGGALANPVGAVFRTAKAGAGILKTGLLGAREGAVQGALTGLGENVGTTEGAAKPTASGAAYGALFGGAVPASIRLGEKATHIGRILSAKPLGKVAQEMDDSMTLVDEVLYGKVREEAGKVGTSPAIREVLESQTIAPFAKMVRTEEATAGLNDAETLIEAYKLMSAAQRKATKSQEGTAEYLAGIALRGKSIGKAKGRMLDAGERVDEEAIAGEVPISLLHPAGTPGLRTAVREHAESAAKGDAFANVADAISGVIYGKSIKGKKLLLNSPEALERAIKQMTPGEAEAGLKAVYGRAREALHLAPNPLSGYGTKPAIYHAVRAPGQVDKYVRLLEEQALKRSPVPTVIDDARSFLPGLLGRIAGSGK